MRALLALLLTLPLCAQEAAKPAGAAKPEETKQEAAKPAGEAKPEETKKEGAAPAAAAASPVPAAESSISGSVDFGYRWVSTAGNLPTYRSIVNLGEGLKLFGADLTFQDPKKRLFDRLDVRANNWGGDPYNTVQVSARKTGVYDFRADYRNIVYYNFLPSFADPSAALGVFLNQRSYDIHRRTTDIHLDLRPGKSIIPYLAYGRGWNSGSGITTFVSNGNEYPVRNQVRDALDNYRGGVRLEMKRWHATIEQGGTVLRDDQSVYTADRNLGNRSTLYFDQQLFLTNLQQAYGVRGHSIYTKALASASPLSWVNLYGQYIYSRPQNDIHYSQNNAGNFAVINPLLFYTAQQDLFSGVAKMPHTSANVGAELRPFKRLRILESWMTDRLHNNTFGALTDQLINKTTITTSVPLALGDNLVMNYNQQQVDAFFDVTNKITLRGGHRFVWGDAVVPPSSLTPLGESGQERRQVGIGGLMFRAGGKLSATVDFEGSSASHSYFRTSLHNYQLLRARARYQAFTSLGFAADFSYLNNENPETATAVSYKFLNRNTTFSAFWTPAGGKRISVIAEYTRSSLRSDIGFLDPGLLSPQRSFYRDNAHTGDLMADFTLPSYGGGLAPKLSFGGAFFKSAGSRPTSYYQPVGRFSVPLQKHVAVVAEWRYYGYNELFYQYEAFRAHLFTTGLRLTR